MDFFLYQFHREMFWIFFLTGTVPKSKCGWLVFLCCTPVNNLTLCSPSMILACSLPPAEVVKVDCRMTEHPPCMVTGSVLPYLTMSPPHAGGDGSYAGGPQRPAPYNSTPQPYHPYRRNWTTSSIIIIYIVSIYFLYNNSSFFKPHNFFFFWNGFLSLSHFFSSHFQRNFNLNVRCLNII